MLASYLVPIRSVSAMCVLAIPGLAQIGTLNLPTGTGNDPRSVSFIGNNHVVVSNQVDGWQHYVNVSNPAAPTLTTSFNPPYGDQWFEAEYTPAHGGRLITGHRGGGLVMVDVSNPATPTVAASVGTIYHYRGLRYLATPVAEYLFYNETNWGLKVFDLTGGNQLVPGWNNYANATNDGNGLELLGTYLYQYGSPANAPTTRELKAFDLVAPATPAQVYFNSSAGVASGNAHVQVRKSPIGPRMLASRYFDGLDLVDVTNPASPVTTKIIPASVDILCWGSFFLPNSVYSVSYGFVRINNVWQYWWLFMVVPPAGAVVPVYAGPSPMDIHDMSANPATNRIYVVGRNATVLTQGLLHIY